MALTAEQKRQLRANATKEDRKAEADRGKVRRQHQSEPDKQRDRDRRKLRRKEVLLDALDDDDAANAQLDAAAARAHWYRTRKDYTALHDEQAKAARQAEREKRNERLRLERKQAREAPEPAGRVLPSLAKQVPNSQLRRQEKLHPAYYERHIDAKYVYVPVGRKCNPSTGGLRPYGNQHTASNIPTAWQRAEETMYDCDEWSCDVAGDGCLKPTDLTPEPARPYNVWMCSVCPDPKFTVCEVCHASARHEHPLRLSRMTPWANKR